MIQGIRKSVVYMKMSSRGLSVCTGGLFTQLQTVTSPSFRVGESQAEVCMTHPSIVALVLDFQFIDKHELTPFHLKYQHEPITNYENDNFLFSTRNSENKIDFPHFRGLR
jgi:hypothetical protein